MPRNTRSVRARRWAVGAALVGLALCPTWASAEPDLRIVDAARQRDRAAVTALLKQGAGVAAAQADGATALHWAAHWNELEMADALLRAGAPVNAANEYGATPLWLASVNGSAPMIARLVKAGARTDAALVSGETPLMAAARSGNVDAVNALIAGGADVNARETARGQTALMWAAAEKHANVMRALIEHGADVARGSASGFTPLMFVAREGDVECARLLLDRGVDVNAAAADGSTPLLVATVRGHVELAELLLDKGANPNADAAGYTPLHWAAGMWETSTTFDYTFRTGEWTALLGIPSREGKLRLIRSLLAHGANVNTQAKSSPPRFGFTLFGQNATALSGATPFFLAAMVADVDVMRMLMASGANVTMPIAEGVSPLIAAAGRFRVDNETRIPEARVLEAVQLLVSAGADVNGSANNGETALHGAALAGLNSVVQFLVDKGANLNAKTKDGKTPLATARGTVVAMQLVVRPDTVAFLRKLGGVE